MPSSTRSRSSRRTSSTTSSKQQQKQKKQMTTTTTTTINTPTLKQSAWMHPVVRAWLVSLRPWSFPASLGPVALTGALLHRPLSDVTYAPFQEGAPRDVDPVENLLNLSYILCFVVVVSRFFLFFASSFFRSFVLSFFRSFVLPRLLLFVCFGQQLFFSLLCSRSLSLNFSLTHMIPTMHSSFLPPSSGLLPPSSLPFRDRDPSFQKYKIQKQKKNNTVVTPCLC